MQFSTFISIVAAVGIGTVIAALVGHQTSISNHRQAWINALRDDLAEYFKALQKIDNLMPAYLQDSQKHEATKGELRAALFFVYERIRLRLNRTEKLHVELEQKLREFLTEPIHQAMAGRSKVDEAVDLARRLLKREWSVTKHPWKAYYWRGESNEMNWRSGTFRLWIVGSTIWGIYVAIARVPLIWWEVSDDDVFGDQWLPMWASLTTYVQPYANPVLGMHPNPPGTILTPSVALVVARIGDTLFMAALPPLAVLLVVLGFIWAATGFRRTSN